MSEVRAGIPLEEHSMIDGNPSSDKHGWVETSKEKVEKVAGQTAEYIQRKPYQALAIAAGIGFVAGLILKRR